MSHGLSLNPGSPCWVDVSSRDPAASRDFYGGLFGWSYHIDPDPENGHYTLAMLGDRPVAGMAGVPAVGDQPVAWTLYLTSANIVHLATLVQQRGGRVLYGPQELPGQGSLLVATDPTGGPIGFWQPTAGWVFRTADPGTLCWAELNTRDGAPADEFFASMFGYHQHQIGDGRAFDYTTWSLGEQTLLGRLQMGGEFPADTPPHWMLYFAADPARGTDGAVERVEMLGGTVHVEPFDSGFGRIAMVSDPSGAMFSLLDTSRVVNQEPSRAEVDDPYDD